MRTIYIYGASGHGSVVYEAARSADYKIMGFIDDEQKQIFGYTSIGLDDFAYDMPVALGIGDNIARSRAYKRLQKRQISPLSVIHPSAIVSKSAQIGKGVFISAGAVVNANSIIKDGAIINTGAIVEHDCVVGAFAHIAPNATLGGAVSVGENTLLGIGSVVKPMVRIGADIIIGAGSVVVNDLDAPHVYKGNPAK